VVITIVPGIGLYCSYRDNKDKYREILYGAFIVLLLVNVFLQLKVITGFPDDPVKATEWWEDIIFLNLIALAVCLHICSIFFFKPKTQLITQGASIFLVLIVCVSFRPSLVEIMDIGLRLFSVGGNLPVDLKDKGSNESIIKGRVTLLGPELIYVNTEQEALILPRADYVIGMPLPGEREK